jgi:hypothetical protein
LQRLEASRSELRGIEGDLAAAQAALAAINGQLAGTPQTIAVAGPAGGARGALAQATAELSGMRARGLTDNHPDVISMKNQVASLRVQAQGEGANDRMYFELMLHARRKLCTHFDFGRSKTGSGAYDFKRNWGFEPEPLDYACWTASGAAPRDADPTSAKHALQIALWRKLPLALASRIGPSIARGLG